ncbi:uncharacterized protein LOC134542555 [Bacillus rossius redtenbacheri]|uniref:uncharacterized protein LOC134542555 n=1 Tax=Bacillus rossius redtenbacheri TaxID=93214 RepID=UPI002FDE76D0
MPLGPITVSSRASVAETVTSTAITFPARLEEDLDPALTNFFWYELGVMTGVLLAVLAVICVVWCLRRTVPRVCDCLYIWYGYITVGRIYRPDDPLQAIVVVSDGDPPLEAPPATPPGEVEVLPSHDIAPAALPETRLEVEEMPASSLELEASTVNLLEDIVLPQVSTAS